MYVIAGGNADTAYCRPACFVAVRDPLIAMSTTHGQPGLSSDQRSTIRSTILSTRHTLEDELRRQLEKYGIYEDKKLPLNKLTHLSAEELHTRDRIDAAIERELESTEGDLERSITNYVREATKTYLNRFVALKTIEVRGLVEETITERPEYGNRSYMHHTVAEIAGELTNAPDDGFGAALALAYQEIGAEIRMIFEESEHTAFDLDAQVREEVLDELDAIDDNAWESDEALGWVYQFFGEEEREEIDERVDDENYKIAGTDIATKTQLFTPRYIVEWMVDNSLGRTWLEMQGERTNIDAEDNCFYLAPLEDSLIDREEKPVEEITVLDPACGSGHMLFYAFDVLYQMYLEEGEVPKKYIPREILRNNLYGIDIDSGAAQIAALSLYLKAKEKSPNVAIPQLNIVSADAVLVNGDRKEAILNQAKSEIEKDILEAVWDRFDNIREFGSLVQVEEKIDEVLGEKVDEIKSTGQTEFTEGGGLAKQASVVTFDEEDETRSWDQIKAQLLNQVSALSEEALEHNDPIEEMFVGEVKKSVRLLDLIISQYDVVVSNPPYLGSSKMDSELKNFVKDNYLGSKDLSTAFIERCSDFVGDDQFFAMVTPENFMFQYSYRKLRERILKQQEFIETAHLSGHSFSGGDRPFTASFVMAGGRHDWDIPSRFYRLTHEQQEYKSHEKKIRGLEEVIKHNRNGKSHNDVYTVDQEAFLEIERTPIVYWFGSEILNYFLDEDSDRISEPQKGLSTGDDERFLRKWWEVPRSEIGEKYEWIMTSGDDDDYYTSSEKVVLWENNGEMIKEASGSHTRGESAYKTPGLTCRKFGNEFTARKHPVDHIFAESAYFISSKENADTAETIGYLCSSFVRYIMNGLNPSMHFNTSAISSLPLPTEVQEHPEIAALVGRAVEVQKERFSLREIKREFSDSEDISRTLNDYHYREDQLLAEIGIIHAIIDELIFSIINLSPEVEQRVYDKFGNQLHEEPVVGKTDSLSSVVFHHINKKNLSESEKEEIVEEISSTESGAIIEIAEEIGQSPLTVANLKYEYGLYSSDSKSQSAARLLSYYLGLVLGHHSEIENLPTSSDGILAFGDTYDNNVYERVQECFKYSFDNPEEMESKVEKMLGKDIEEWLSEQFFRNHHCKEYRRRGQRIPIYWQLESPKGAFSCFIYYHKIGENTLPKLRGQYLDPRIDELENELETLNAQTSGDDPDKELLKRKEEVQNDLDDLNEFRETIDEMIDDGVSVDVERGIWENIKEWDQYDVLETGLPKLKSSYSR